MIFGVVVFPMALSRQGKRRNSLTNLRLGLEHASRVSQQARYRKRMVENNSDHPHPPYSQKLCPQNMPYNGGAHGIKVGENQGISTESVACGANFYGIRTPPFMPYEPFLLGVGA